MREFELDEVYAVAVVSVRTSIEKWPLASGQRLRWLQLCLIQNQKQFGPPCSTSKKRRNSSKITVLGFFFWKRFGDTAQWEETRRCEALRFDSAETEGPVQPVFFWSAFADEEASFADKQVHWQSKVREAGCHLAEWSRHVGSSRLKTLQRLNVCQKAASEPSI